MPARPITAAEKVLLERVRRIGRRPPMGELPPILDQNRAVLRALLGDEPSYDETIAKLVPPIG